MGKEIMRKIAFLAWNDQSQSLASVDWRRLLPVPLPGKTPTAVATKGAGVAAGAAAGPLVVVAWNAMQRKKGRVEEEEGDESEEDGDIVEKILFPPTTWIVADEPQPQMEQEEPQVDEDENAEKDGGEGVCHASDQVLVWCSLDTTKNILWLTPNLKTYSSLSPDHQSQVQVLLSLVASVYFYQDEGCITSEVLRKLSWIQLLSNKCHVRLGQDDEMAAKVLYKYMPRFVWIGRSFKNKWLVDKEGKQLPTTPEKYFEQALAPQSGMSETIEEENAIRICFTKLFTTRHFVPLPREYEDSTQEAARQLRPEFIKQVKKLRTHHMDLVQSKTCFGMELSVDMIAKLMDCLVNDINLKANTDGGLIILKKTLTEVAHDRCANALTGALKRYCDQWKAEFPSIENTTNQNESIDEMFSTLSDMKSFHIKHHFLSHSYMKQDMQYYYFDDDATVSTDDLALEFSSSTSLQDNQWEINGLRQRLTNEVEQDKHHTNNNYNNGFKAGVSCTRSSHYYYQEEEVDAKEVEQRRELMKPYLTSLHEQITRKYTFEIEKWERRCKDRVASYLEAFQLDAFHADVLRRLNDVPHNDEQIFFEQVQAITTEYDVQLKAVLKEINHIQLSRPEEAEAYGKMVNDFLLQVVLKNVFDFGEQLRKVCRLYSTSLENELQCVKEQVQVQKTEHTKCVAEVELMKKTDAHALEVATDRLAREKGALRDQLEDKKTEMQRILSQLQQLQDLQRRDQERHAQKVDEMKAKMAKLESCTYTERERREMDVQLAHRELLESERGFHKSEKDLLVGRNGVMDRLIALERALMEDETAHIQNMFLMKKKAQDEYNAESERLDAEYRALQSRSTEDTVLMKKRHEAKKAKLLGELKELRDQRAALQKKQQKYEKSMRSSLSCSPSSVDSEMSSGEDETVMNALEKSTPQSSKTPSSAKSKRRRAKKPDSAAACAQQ